jgi:GDP-D-mannose dehydratase
MGELTAFELNEFIPKFNLKTYFETGTGMGGKFISRYEVHKMQYFTDKLIEASGIPYDSIEQRIDPKLYRDIDIQVQIGDSYELKQLTNWEPTISIEQTMADLLNYWVKKLR